MIESLVVILSVWWGNLIGCPIQFVPISAELEPSNPKNGITLCKTFHKDVLLGGWGHCIGVTGHNIRQTRKYLHYYVAMCYYIRLCVLLYNLACAAMLHAPH